MVNFPFKTKPWDHQKKFFEESIKHKNFAAFFEVGAGKSKATIDSMRYRYFKHSSLLKTLIVGPPIIIQNWKNELLKNSNIAAHDIITLTGAGKKRAFTMKGIVDLNRIVITNYQSLLMSDVYEALEAWGPEIIVADEVHYLKNPSSKRSKAMYKLADDAHYRYALTGTPILNTPMDVFGIFRFLDSGDSFGKNHFAFRNKYFYDKNAGMPSQKHFPNWQPRPMMMKDLSERMATISHHVTKDECLDLPPLVKQVYEVELSPEQKKLYKDMQSDLLAFIGDGDKAGVARLALTRALRLQQIVSGHLTVEDIDGQSSTHRVKKNPRADALREILESLEGKKIIIWAIFKEDYKIIREVCDALKRKSVEVHGGVTAKKKDEAVDSFNNDPSVDVFIGHPQSGGIGINLVVSNYTVYYSRSFSLEQDIQSEARNYRGGSEMHDKVTRIDLVAKGTIDEMVLARLANKQQISDDILLDMVRVK